MQPVQTPAVTGTKDWTKVEVVFETDDRDTIQINCLFGGWGFAKGKAWYDDISLELISTKEIKPSVTIRADREKEPMSPYIYGQFIEHLGRCIYGGIWAEMLEDRKFFYPVASRLSPWKVFGSSTEVKMIKKGAYVGEHSPQITVKGKPGGIVHGGLGLEKGKKYVGRIVVAASQTIEAVEVSLRWGNGKEDTFRIESLSGEFEKKNFTLSCGGNTYQGELRIIGIPKSGSTGWFRIGAVSLMPSDNIHGMRRDTISLLKELDSPIYRWPGGNFVSGYNWKDAIGDPDKRPPRKNPAWRGIEHNDFGIDEFMTFCKVLGTEPLVVVNSGLGDAELARQEVQYANGSVNTPMGRLRARNGHAEPYKVKWWGIGNEMYGSWQLGHMPVEKYVKKHNEFAKVMRKEDPNVKLIGVGAVGRWDEFMLKYCADYMDLISEHFYCGERKGIISHVRQIPNAIRAKAQAHRKYRQTIPQLKGKDIRIAMDEWNYWYGPHIYGELGVRYHLKDALGIASGINEYSRNTDIIFMANYAQTVNVIGCIKTSKTRACFATTGLVLRLYRKHFGSIPVEVEGNPSPLDVGVCLSEDRKNLTISVVNPLKEKILFPVKVKGVALRGKGRAWVISHKNPLAYNEPGKEPQVKIRELRVPPFKGSLEVEAYSVSLFSFRIR